MSDRFSGEICIQKGRVGTRVIAFEMRYVSRRGEWVHEWSLLSRDMYPEGESGYMSDGFRGEICIQKKRVDT
ncbi:hypothetical protein [Bacillus sp. P14.5]|uniref:hypothetical protein n=1 Tax=Bacillus sp. P14.5 TaxID=1983400 RepID=UPI000DE912AE|nr:hypothetical protein [Bacillus sp. P14.5]